MMAQVDGTPYDWLGDRRRWCMHLAVDDATTRVLGGWFMEHECMRGYARMMREAVTRHGVPRSIYSDRDPVFRSTKDGSPTQFALMARDLGMNMVFANSPQTKGRVERYNFTAQLRLPTDVVRFGITSYDDSRAQEDCKTAGKRPTVEPVQFVRRVRNGRKVSVCLVRDESLGSQAY